MACCKDKGVRTQCLGICDMDEDKSKSEARFVGGCHVYEEVILECVNGNQFYIYTWVRGILKIAFEIKIGYKRLIWFFTAAKEDKASRGVGGEGSSNQVEMKTHQYKLNWDQFQQLIGRK